jgi:hypothetical protein
MCQGAVSRDR